MARSQKKKPAPPPIDPDMGSPSRTALHMLHLGYGVHYVALWLWHMTRVEADVGVPESVPEVLR